MDGLRVRHPLHLLTANSGGQYNFIVHSTESRGVFMSKSYLGLNGERFEVVNPFTKEGQAIIARLDGDNIHRGYVDIFDAYGRPSEAKRLIWEYWRQWFLSCEGSDKNHDIYSYDMYIPSRCTSNFTISFYMTKGNRHLYGYITKSHNKVVIV